MSELELEITQRIRFCINWKGDDIRYEESLKKETVTKIMQIIQQERIKAQGEVSKEHDKEMDEVLEERDYAEEWADLLSYAIGGEDIGEHSNINNPWKNALELLDELKKSLAEKEEK